MNVVLRFCYKEGICIQRARSKKHSRAATSQKAPPSVNSWRIASSRAPKSISRTGQGRQRVRDAVAKAAPGEARLCEINAGFGMTSAAATETRTVTVILPPTMPQPQGTLMLQPVLGVVVGGTMVGGAPPTRGDDGKKCRQGKDAGIGKVHHSRRCKYCVQHGRSLEEASNCPGRGGRSLCMGGERGTSLECVTCNSTTKCSCPMPDQRW